MTEQAIEAEAAPPAKSIWGRLPISARAIISGLAVALVGVNLWGLMLFSIGPSWALIPPAILMLGILAYWISGRAWPDRTSMARSVVFRPITLKPSQWVWGLIAALLFAVVIEAAFVITFRIVPYPERALQSAFALPGVSTPLVWALIGGGALVGGLCEEAGFRGYLQLPIERRHGPLIAIAASTLFFTAFHYFEIAAALPLLPLFLIAGALLGLLAWAANSLIPCIIGHALMSFATIGYWETGQLGQFKARPITEAGLDMMFWIALATLIISVLGFLFMIVRLRLTPQTA